MKFILNVLATLVALTLFFGFGFLIMIGIFSVLGSEKKVELSENTILHLKLEKPITERTIENPFGGYYPFQGGSTVGVLELIDAINHASQDENIAGIFLDLSWISGGFAQVEEIRSRLIDFKDSGKFVIAYGTMMSEGSYYLASAADSIFLMPEGDLEFNGIAYTGSFFKGTLDKLEIEAQVFKVGDYKSAVEPFIRKDMSDENREQVESFINDIYDKILSDISKSRMMDVAEVKEISSSLKIRSADDALANGLIDGLKYADEIDDLLLEISGEESGKKPKLVTLNKYLNSYSNVSKSKNRIAEIVAYGEIVQGQGEQNMIGADKFVKEIRNARRNKNVKAVVLRINSPGGDFFASDELWREVMLTRKEKTVIASMSTYAASGGYYMAMAADTIVAYPNTITGSIGIFSIIFNVSGFLENKLGITTDVVKTGDFSDILTASRPLTDYEKSIYQKHAEDGYNTFITKAAEGRHMSTDDIISIASGRVWTGTQAKANGLVDILGTFEDAVQIASEKAGIGDDYKLRFYPAQKTFFEQLMADLGMEAKAMVIQQKTGELYQYVRIIEKLNYYNGIQARMPWEGEFTF